MTREEAYSSIDWQEITKYRCHHNTNIVPIGLPERAGYRHRALLFKVKVFFIVICIHNFSLLRTKWEYHADVFVGNIKLPTTQFVFR